MEALIMKKKHREVLMVKQKQMEVFIMKKKHMDVLIIKTKWRIDYDEETQRGIDAKNQMGTLIMKKHRDAGEET